MRLISFLWRSLVADVRILGWTDSKRNISFWRFLATDSYNKLNVAIFFFTVSKAKENRRFVFEGLAGRSSFVTRKFDPKLSLFGFLWENVFRLITNEVGGFMLGFTTNANNKIWYLRSFVRKTRKKLCLSYGDCRCSHNKLLLRERLIVGAGMKGKIVRSIC